MLDVMIVDGKIGQIAVTDIVHALMDEDKETVAQHYGLSLEAVKAALAFACACIVHCTN